MPLVPATASCDTDGVINDTIVFLRGRQSERCNMTFFGQVVPWNLCDMMLTASSMVPLHSLGQDNQNEVQHDFFDQLKPLAPASESHNAGGIVNSTITILMSR